jgi:hypothetical protein
MLARYYGPGMGRFLAVDPRLESADPLKPQSWNRYSYVVNRPLIAIDPSGEADVIVNDPKDLTFFEAELQKTAGPGITLTNKTVQVDDSKLTPGSTYSQTARDTLKDAASTSTPGTIVLSKNADPALTKTGEGRTRGGPAPPGAAGPDAAVVEVSGRNFGGLKDSSGNPVPGPSEVTLIHEIGGHAVPFLKGQSPGGAVAFDNIVRQELGLPLRAPEPGH